MFAPSPSLHSCLFSLLAAFTLVFYSLKVLYTGKEYHSLFLKLKKIQGLFKDLHRNSRTFQGKMEFKDFSRTPPKIQGLFKTVRTLVLMFLCSCGENVARKLFLFPSMYRQNWFPPHSFVPTPVLPSFHDLTSAHKRVLPPIVEKFRVLFFSTIQTKHNSQSRTYCYLALRGALECDLS